MRTSSQRSVPSKIASIQDKPGRQNGTLRAGARGAETSDELAPAPTPAKATMSVVIIERRAFVRGCIQSILSEATTLDGVGVASVEEYLARTATLKAAIVVLCTIGMSAREVDAQLTRLQAVGGGVPVVVMSDADDPELVMTVMDKGANGFMPADISLEVAAHALRLVAAGGQYFPAGSLLAARKLMAERQSASPGPRGRRAAQGQGEQDHRLRAQHVREHGQGARAQYHEEAQRQEPHRGRLPRIRSPPGARALEKARAAA
jgi:DNA-binding NarL/FixJ family response regulator